MPPLGLSAGLRKAGELQHTDEIVEVSRGESGYIEINRIPESSGL